LIDTDNNNKIYPKLSSICVSFYDNLYMSWANACQGLIVS